MSIDSMVCDHLKWIWKMNTTTEQYNDSENENDDGNDDSATQPLLLQSSMPTIQAANANSTTATATGAATATIKLPTLMKSNSAKHFHNNNNNENRVCIKFGQFVNYKFHRIDGRRPHHRDKWNRINIGLFTISFLSVVYLCVSLNLNIDKPSPQLIVDVPPIDANSLGSKGKYLKIKKIEVNHQIACHSWNSKGNQCILFGLC